MLFLDSVRFEPPQDTSFTSRDFLYAHGEIFAQFLLWFFFMEFLLFDLSLNLVYLRTHGNWTLCCVSSDQVENKYILPRYLYCSFATLWALFVNSLQSPLNRHSTSRNVIKLKFPPPLNDETCSNIYNDTTTRWEWRFKVYKKLWMSAVPPCD